MNGVRVFVTVMSPGSRTTPLTDEARSQFASYAAAIVRGAPSIRNVIVGNEPNLNRFWLPQFDLDGSSAAPRDYLALLARDLRRPEGRRHPTCGCTAAPSRRVGPTERTGSDRRTRRRCSSASSALPTARADAPVRSWTPMSSTCTPTTRASPRPSRTRTTTSIGVADYPKLVALLGEAFDGTAQPGSTLPIVYGEFGVESQIPASKSALYTGDEPTTTKPVDEATQATYYRAGPRDGVLSADRLGHPALPHARRAVERRAGSPGSTTWTGRRRRARRP